ncbi:MAG TPA: hypothetical protein VHI71_00885 [Actinomycetota bacterium]|nr:hypothetical protein [Actinomycetota bacterium]
MRELFIEELEGVVGGQKLPDVNDYMQTTMACCEEGPFGCCWYGEVIRDVLNSIVIEP